MDSVQCLVILSPRAPDMLWDESHSGNTRPLKYTGKKWLCYVQAHMSCVCLTVYAGMLQSICPIVRSLSVLQHKFIYQLKLSCQTFKTLFQFLTHQYLLKRTKVSKKKRKETKAPFFLDNGKAYYQLEYKVFFVLDKSSDNIQIRRAPFSYRWVAKR